MTRKSFINTRETLLNYVYLNADLRKRLESCGTPAPWGWAFCRSTACQRCRKYRASDWAREASDLLGRSDPVNIRWVTIMLTPVSHVSAIKPQIMKVRKDLRNLAARLRRKYARADSLRMLGAFESDWYFPHHVPRLSGYKRRQLEDIGFDYTGQEVWFPHLHMLVDLGGASEYRFRELLERKWPGYRRVDFKTLDGSKTLAQNVQNLMGYTLKCKHRYDIDPFRSETASTVRWPADVVEKYHIHLQENGGFAMLRFHLRPTRTEQTVIGYDDEYIDDYMPVVV